MKCPACDAELLMSERQGVEIDYCPKCRGVWLDRGEIDKIIERSVHNPADRDDYDRDYSRRYPQEKDASHHGQQHKKKSWLNDLCD